MNDKYLNIPRGKEQLEQDKLSMLVDIIQIASSIIIKKENFINYLDSFREERGSIALDYKVMDYEQNNDHEMTKFFQDIKKSNKDIILVSKSKGVVEFTTKATAMIRLTDTICTNINKDENANVIDYITKVSHLICVLFNGCIIIDVYNKV